jgi:hypothetical protein
MSHSLIIGVTESGKTTFARVLARQLAKKKQNVIVYDPVGTQTMGGGWPESAFIFDNEQDFWKYIGRDDVGHSHVFVDEGGDLFNLSKPENHWLLTRGRHYGFFVYLICQRPKMVAPSVRHQCGTCYMFRLAMSDATEISKDYGHEWPLDNAQLDAGDYYTLHSGRLKFERANIFTILKRKGPK